MTAREIISSAVSDGVTVALTPADSIKLKANPERLRNGCLPSSVGEDLGMGFYAGLKVRHPTGGDWYEWRSLAAVEQASGL